MATPGLDYELIFVIVLAFAVYINTLGHGFVYDDNRAILTNPDVQASSSFLQVFQNDFWGTPLSSSNSHGSYRPLCVLSFRLNNWLTGFKPFSYHLTNVAFHAVATSLVLVTSRALLPAKSPLIAAALFAVHPVHVEAVAGVVGRADVLASIFFMSSFLLYIKHVKVRDSVVLRKVLNPTDSTRTNLKAISRTKRTKDNEIHFLNELFKYNDKQRLRLNLFPKHEQFYFSLFLFSSTCAVLSKEPGIMVIPLAVCYDIILHLRSKRISSFRTHISVSVSASLLAFVVINLFRLYIMGLHTPIFSKADNPTAKEAQLLTRTLTFFYLPIFNFLLLIWPQWQSFDWSMETISRVHSLLDIRNLFSLCFYYFMYRTVHSSLKMKNIDDKRLNKSKNCKICTKDLGEEHLQTCKSVNNNNIPVNCECNIPSCQPLSRGSLVTMCLVFMVLPFIPASNLFFYVGFVIAERVLYIPSVGFCMLIALCAHSLWSIVSGVNKYLVVGGLLLLMTTFAARSVQRSQDWKSEESLYRSAIYINPPKAYGNLGSVLSSAGRLEEAETMLRLALAHRPNMADVHYNLGNLLTRQLKYQEAVFSYQQAIHYRPSLAEAYLNLGQVFEILKKWSDAESVYRKCIRLDVSGLKDPNSHEKARTSCRHRLKSKCEAKDCLKESFQLINSIETKTESHPSPFLNRDESNMEQSMRISISTNETRSREEEIYLRALQKSPNDPAVYINYGQLLVQLGRLSEAATMYVRAAELSPRHYALVTSAAVALRQANRLSEAEILYKQALDIRPLDSSSHSNLGAIFHLQGKYRQAATSYKEALRLSPHDQVTLTNLQKLRNLLSRNKR